MFGPCFRRAPRMCPLSCRGLLRLAVAAIVLMVAVAAGPIAVSAGPQAMGFNEKPTVYLTFDDGPFAFGEGAANHTLAYLALLERFDVQATFFMTGKAASARPEVAAAVVNGGHAVGNHSFSHPPLNRLPEASVREQFIAANSVLTALTGSPVSCYRPPYGATSATVHRAAISVGLTNDGWTANYPTGHLGGWHIDTSDYRGSSAYVASQLNRIQGGEVVLMHDVHATSYQPLADWLTINRTRFNFEPLPGCGGSRPAPVPDPEHPERWYRFAIGRLYLAYFQRRPEPGGLDYWDSVFVRHRDLDQISNQFVRSQEFVLNQPAIDDATYLDLVYRHVLRRLPDEEGRRYWRSLLEAGAIDRGRLMTLFSESDEFVVRTAPDLTADCFNGDLAASFACTLEPPAG